MIVGTEAMLKRGCCEDLSGYAPPKVGFDGWIFLFDSPRDVLSKNQEQKSHIAVYSSTVLL